MKRFLSMLMVLAMVLSFAACGGNDEPEKNNEGDDIPVSEDISKEEEKEEEPSEEPEEEDKSYTDLVETIAWAESVCGVAYVGFVEGPVGDGYRPIFEEQKELMEWYPFIADIPYERIVEADGYDLYCIVPASLDCSVKVEMLYFPEEEDAWEPVVGDVIYESESGEPIIVRCNESDIFSNVLVTVTDPNGNEKKFSPYLSLVDGSLAGINEDESGLLALDFSRYEINLDAFYTFEELAEGNWVAYYYYDNASTYVMSLEFFYNEDNEQRVEFWYGLENSEIDEIFEGPVYENEDDEGNWDGGYTLDLGLTGGAFYNGDTYSHVCTYKFQKSNEELTEAFALHYGLGSAFFEGCEYQPFYFYKAQG
ncbi:MAG: hypothetical protein IJ283_09195 [Oscillospiraceae bacterium]|nr:hypothetical protein [Oscillospiraceae bacterium]